MQVRHEDLNTRKTAASLNWPIGFGLLTLLALALGANLGAFEGDDINSVVPMLHLQEAIAGDLVIYRYAWQPLSYQLGAAILSVTGHPDWVYLCAPLAAAVTLTLILITIQKQARRTHPAWVFPALLFLLPELFFSGLYFNSTILGLPFLAAATLLILSGSERLWRMLTAGLLAGVAILMRIDFVLACPMLAAIAFGTGNRIRQPLAIAAGVMTMLVFGLVSGLLDLPAMIEVYRTSSEEIAQKSNQPGWNLHTKLWVASAALHPLGYLLSGASAALLLFVKVRRHPLFILALAFGTLPLLYPVASLLSPKYLLPLMVFLPLAWLHALEWLQDRYGSWWSQMSPRLLAGAAALSLVVAIEPARAALPFTVSILEPKRVGTHDGPRTYGAYVQHALSVRQGAARQPGEQKAAAALLDTIENNPGLAIILSGDEGYFNRGGIGWRTTQLVAAKRGYRSELLAPHLLAVQVGAGYLLLSDTPERAEKMLPRDVDQILPIDLRECDGCSARSGVDVVNQALTKTTYTVVTQRSVTQENNITGNGDDTAGFLPNQMTEPAVGSD